MNVKKHAFTKFYEQGNSITIDLKKPKANSLSNWLLLDLLQLDFIKDVTV